MEKYEILLNDNIELGGRVILYRIKALRDFGNVKAGDLGGYIEKEYNLSHEGNCWVYDYAKVFGNARVSGYAVVYDNAWVYGDARVSGNAKVYDNALVSGDAWVSGNAIVTGETTVNGYAKISGNAYITSNNDYAVAQYFGRLANDTITFCRLKDSIEIGVCPLHQSFTLNEFRELSTKNNSYIAGDYTVLADLMQKRFDRLQSEN